MSTPSKAALDAITQWPDRKLESFQKHYRNAASRSDTPSVKQWYTTFANAITEERVRRMYNSNIVSNNQFVVINLPEGSKGEKVGDFMHWTPGPVTIQNELSADAIKALTGYNELLAENEKLKLGYVYWKQDPADGTLTVIKPSENALPIGRIATVREYNELKSRHAQQAETIGQTIANNRELFSENRKLLAVKNELFLALEAEKASHAESREGYRLQYEALGQYQAEEKKMLAEIERLNRIVSSRTTTIQFGSQFIRTERTPGKQLSEYLLQHKLVEDQRICYQQDAYDELLEELKDWPELHLDIKALSRGAKVLYFVKILVDLNSVVPNSGR